jgi:hypothetical protein
VDGTQAALITLDKDMRRKPKVNYSESRDGDREDFDIVCNLRKQKNGKNVVIARSRRLTQVSVARLLFEQEMILKRLTEFLGVPLYTEPNGTEMITGVPQ